MRMAGEERIGATRNRVWEALNDSNILRQCIPGCHSLEREAVDRLRAIVEIKIGPIGARFDCAIALADLDPPQGYTIIGTGQGGTIGSARSSIKVRLAENSGVTLLSYEVDTHVGGRLAQLGGPLIDASAKQFARTFFTRFGEVVTGAEGVTPPLQSALAARSSSPVETVSAARPSLPFTTASAARSPLSVKTAPSSGRFPIVWTLAVALAALVGLLVGRAQKDGSGSDWMGLAIGLLIALVAAAAFELGRRTAAPQVILDSALLKRLLSGEER